MNTIEASLDPACFVRIDRSHIVNVKRIKPVWTLGHRTIPGRTGLRRASSCPSDIWRTGSTAVESVLIPTSRGRHTITAPQVPTGFGTECRTKDRVQIADHTGTVGKHCAVREDRLLCIWSYLPLQGRSIR